MTIGDMRVERPVFFTIYGKGAGEAQKGTVVYIHPKRRFYTVEFVSEITGEKFRQSFYFEDRRVSADEESEEKHEDDSNHEQQGRRRKNRHRH